MTQPQPLPCRAWCVAAGGLATPVVLYASLYSRKIKVYSPVELHSSGKDNETPDSEGQRGSLQRTASSGREHETLGINRAMSAQKEHMSYYYTVQWPCPALGLFTIWSTVQQLCLQQEKRLHGSTAWAVHI